MTRPRLSNAATVLLLAGLLALGTLRRQGDPQVSPRDPIYAMLDAARAGDGKRYLEQYTGSMAALLKRTAEEKTDTGFQIWLKSCNAEVKGVAISDPQMISDREASIHVEYVYQDRNEIQLVFVEQVGRAWKIARVDSAEQIKTLVPYGAPVE
jgi:hypothetical protein